MQTSPFLQVRLRAIIHCVHQLKSYECDRRVPYLKSWCQGFRRDYEAMFQPLLDYFQWFASQAGRELVCKADHLRQEILAKQSHTLHQEQVCQLHVQPLLVFASFALSSHTPNQRLSFLKTRWDFLLQKMVLLAPRLHQIRQSSKHQPLNQLLF